MHQTLFYIPYNIHGVPIFGFGLLFWLWLLMLAIYALTAWRRKEWTAETASTIFLSLIIGGLFCWVVPSIGRPAGIAIQAYGAMMLTAILAAVGVVWLRAPQFGFSRNDVLELSFWLCLSGIIGARVVYVVEYWDRVQSDTLLGTLGNILNFPGGGLVVYGSIIGGALGGAIFLMIKKMSVLRVFDLVAPSLVLGISLGRIGCLLNGCCFGGVCETPDAKCCVTFPAGSPAFMRQLEEGRIRLSLDDFYYGMKFSRDASGDGAKISALAPGGEAERHGVRSGDVVLAINQREISSPTDAAEVLVESPKINGVVKMEILRDGQPKELFWVTTASAGPRSLPVVPTQIYSSAGAFLLFLFLMIYSYFRKSPARPGMRMDGEVAAMMFTVYPAARFLIETVRVDETSFLGTGMSISQNISIGMLCGAAVLWAYLFTRGKK